MDLTQLQDTLKYRFKDPNLLSLALTHRSRSADNYERLEYLGDSILGYVVAKALFNRFSDASEGKLSRMRAVIVQQKSLAIVARDLNLGQYLLLGEGEQKSGGHRRDSILSDVYEAIIGAITIDASLDQSEQFILKTLGNKLDSLSEDVIYKDSKSQLQELLQQYGNSLPDYEVIEVNGPSHHQVFTVSCFVAYLDKTFIASDNSRKRAEQQAAEQALKLVKNG